MSFRTGLAVEPRVEIPVRVMLPHPVNLSSQSLLLTPAGEGLEGTVLLTVRADLDPAAMEVRADPPYAATLERAGSERALRVKVRAPAGAAPGRISFRVGTEETVLPVAPTPGPVPAS